DFITTVIIMMQNTTTPSYRNTIPATIILADDVVTYSVTLNNNTSHNYTVSSANGFGIKGTGTLTKGGLGSLDLNSANFYSGGTTLNQGTLNINNAGSLLPTPNSAIGTGALTITGGTVDSTSGATLVTNT